MPVPLRALILGSLALGLSPAWAAAHASSPASPAPRAVCKGTAGYAAAGGLRTFLWRPEWLAAQKAEIAADEGRKARLTRMADSALRRGPYSVTDKPEAAASGDRHDYVSIGPYWWPNAKAADGKPYVRRDGQVNPERNGERFDTTRFDRMSRDVETLALAWHLLGRTAYAEHAARLIRAWFVAPETRMNPNLDYAQAVPGVSAGRPEGIVEATRLISVVEAMGVLAPSGALTAAEQQAVEQWFADLATWLATSANGKAERAAANNHGIYFDMLLAHFALYARIEPVARKLAQDFPARRLARQIDAEGRLPAETARTRSWHYSVFALEAAANMAMLGECVGVDLWNWAGPDGRGLRKAIGFLLAYRAKPESWPFRDIDLQDPEKRAGEMDGADRLFRIAAWGYADPSLQPQAARSNAAPLWLSDYPR